MHRQQNRPACKTGPPNFHFLPCCRPVMVVAFLLATPTPLLADQGYITAGIGGGLKTLNSYQGVIYAPFGSLSESGLILRGWTKAFRFAYQTDLPTASNVTISAMGLSIEGEAGWQFAFDQTRIAVFGGLVWRKYTLSPNDPGSNINKSRLSFSASVDGEYKFTPDYGIMANASFLQGFNQYWAQAKPYMKVADSWKIGLDTSSAGGKDYNNSRIGLFASDYEFSLWPASRLFLGGEAGVKFSFKDNKTTPYAGINVGYLF